MATRRLIVWFTLAFLLAVGFQAPASAAPLQASYLYELRAVHSGKCLDVRGASLVEQAVVQQFTCHGGANQRWLITEQSDRSVTILAAHSGKCLNVRNESLNDDTPLEQLSCNGRPSQRWWMYFGSDGTITIQSVLSGKCVDIRGASLADQALAQQDPCHGRSNQRFKGRLLS